jgi:glycosyltransferase involved in cell wall biosynthesis
LLRRALVALADQDLPADAFEVVVSVDRSTDGTEELLEQFAAPYALRWVRSSRPGRAAACNAAIAVARGEVIVILDDDMEPTPGLLRNHHGSHPRGSRRCVVGAAPVRLDPDSPPVARYVAAKFADHLGAIGRPGHPFALRDFYSGNASIRRHVLLEVGLFDEAFTLYGNEDLELSLRLRDAAVELCFSADAAADQRYAKNLAGLAEDTFQKGKTAVQLATTHPHAFDGLHLAAYDSVSVRWSGVRAMLLAVTRTWPHARKWILRLALRLERLPRLQRTLYYRFVLDYFYWAGVEASLTDQRPTGPLASLAADLHRGPIRLLLHR